MAYADELHIWNGYAEPITSSDRNDILNYMQYLVDESPLRFCDGRWSVNLFGGKRALGRCQYEYTYNRVVRGEILISEPWFVEIGTKAMCRNSELGEDVLEDTIRHEIAHALAVEDYGISRGKGHGREWKHFARKVHADPTRQCYGVPQHLMASHKRYCPACGTVYKWLFRYAKRTRAYLCSQCDAPKDERRIKVKENPERIV